MKKKFNIKMFFSISLFVFFTYLIILMFYIRSNMNIYVPPKKQEEHLGIFTGVSNDLVDNSIYFSDNNKYNISPKNGHATGPLQVYHLENPNSKLDNNIVIAYFQRDKTTDINIDIMSLEPPDMSVKEMTWFLDGF